MPLFVVWVGKMTIELKIAQIEILFELTSYAFLDQICYSRQIDYTIYYNRALIFNINRIIVTVSPYDYHLNE